MQTMQTNSKKKLVKRALGENFNSNSGLSQMSAKTGPSSAIGPTPSSTSLKLQSPTQPTIPQPASLQPQTTSTISPTSITSPPTGSTVSTSPTQSSLAPATPSTPEPPKPPEPITFAKPPERAVIQFNTDEIESVSPAEVIPELQELKQRLLDVNSQSFNAFKTRYDTYKKAAELLFKKRDENALRTAAPEVHAAIQWMRDVKAGRVDPQRDPQTAQKNLKILWEMGAYNYATKGFQVDPSTPEGRNFIVSRYIDLYNKALGDKRLNEEDLNLVYKNFTSTLGLNPSSPVSYSSFHSWWNSENVSPLYKAGLLLGIPLLAVGLISGLWKGFSTGNILLSLLGGAGLLLGLSSYMSYKPQQTITGFGGEALFPELAADRQAEAKQQTEKTRQTNLAQRKAAEKPNAAADQTTQSAQYANLSGIYARLQEIAATGDPGDVNQLNQQLDSLKQIVNKLQDYNFPSGGWFQAALGLLGGDQNTYIKSALAQTAAEIDTIQRSLQYGHVPREQIAALAQKVNTILSSGIVTIANTVYPGNDTTSAGKKAAILAAVSNTPLDKLLTILQSNTTIQGALDQLAEQGKPDVLHAGRPMQVA